MVLTTASGKTGRNRRGRGAKVYDELQNLIPGIPDEITISTICPKLSWPIFHTLAVVSHEWLRVLQHGEIFEARISSKSTETVFAYPVNGSEALRFALYSMEDEYSYPIPPIPDFTITKSSSIRSFTYTSMHGKLYVIGSMEPEIASLTENWRTFTYEYDLAKHRGWRQCAALNSVFAADECAVINGKIFVFGETNPHPGFSRLAVYDPDKDSWSPIISECDSDADSCSSTSKSVHGGYQKVFAEAGIQDKLVYEHRSVYDSSYTSQYNNWITKFVEPEAFMAPFFKSVSSTDIANAEEEVQSGAGIVVTVIGGKFFKITREAIEAYDCETNTWTPLSFDGPLEFTGSEVAIQDCKSIDVAVARTKNVIYSLLVVPPGWISEFGPQDDLLLVRSVVVSNDINDQTLDQESPVQERSHSQRHRNEIVGRWEIGVSSSECDFPLFEGYLRCPVQL